MNDSNWFEQWSERKTQVRTKENFSSKGNFQKIINSFDAVNSIKELNPEFTSPGELWEIASRQRKGYYYPSVGHPNFTELEKRLTKLETGNLNHSDMFSGLVFPRGMAAISAVLETLQRKNSDGVFICGKVMYPSTKRLLFDENVNARNLIGGKKGVEVDINSPDSICQTIEKIGPKNVLGIIFEPLANPTLNYTSIRTASDHTQRYHIPIIVDNTFLTPYLLEPFRAGADIVVQSLTKYFSGEGDIMGGAAIFPKEFYNNLAETRRHKGYTISPHNAAVFSERINSFPERMEKHCKNTSALAELLFSLATVWKIKVNYPDLGERTRNGYAGGVLSFVFEGDDETAYQRSRKFTEFICHDYSNSRAVKQAVSFAESRTLVLPYAGQIPDIDFLKKNNIPIGLVRIAVGREPIGPTGMYLYEVIKYAIKRE